MTKRIDGDHLEQLLSQSPRLRREINRPEIPEGLSIVFQHEEPAYLFVTDRIGETTRVYRLAEEPGGPAVAHEESRGRDGKQFNVNLWTGHLVGGRLEYQGEDEFVAMLLCHLSFYRLAREERLPTDTSPATRGLRFGPERPFLRRVVSEAEYDRAVAELAAFARLHRALAGPGHPWPTRECLTCPWIEQRRRELARQCPA